MRLWSIHPQYLDAKGLVALWRETLLAKNVLENKTKGYKNHPQLIRFRAQENPLDAIHLYLSEIYKEAQKREYHFDPEKFTLPNKQIQIPVNEGQIAYEFDHLLRKLEARDRPKWEMIKRTKRIALHPLFVAQPGEIEAWEIISNS